MVEKKIELRRRRSRHKKLTKLKDKLGTAKEGKDRDTILAKIRIVSPWWKEPAQPSNPQTLAASEITGCQARFPDWTRPWKRARAQRARAGPILQRQT